MGCFFTEISVSVVLCKLSRQGTKYVATKKHTFSTTFFARSQYLVTNLKMFDTDFLEDSAVHEKILDCIQTKCQRFYTYERKFENVIQMFL